MDEIVGYINSQCEKFGGEEWIGRLNSSLCKNDIEKKIIKACSITGLNVHELLKGLDFEANDLAKERFEALLAELRMIFWANHVGMVDIMPIKRKGEPSADIIAKLNDEKYCIEVFCSPEDYYRWPEHIKKRNDLVEYYIKKAGEKKKQLESCDAEHKILALVLNSSPALQLLDRDDYLAILTEVHEKLGWGKKHFFALITGMVSFIGADDVVYPDIIRKKGKYDQ